MPKDMRGAVRILFELAFIPTKNTSADASFYFQDEIQSKMKAIHNVIEMLSSIIKDGCKISDLEAQLDESPKAHHKNHVKSDVADPSVKYNYMHYDPELHWCRMCDEFPKTAKDFLLHLQGDKHRNNIQENDVGDNTPWHKLPPEQELPCYEGATKKRIPIRGKQSLIVSIRFIHLINFFDRVAIFYISTRLVL
jgi:hypothetical protein